MLRQMTMRGVPGRAAPLRCTVLLPSVGRLGLRPCVTMLVPRSTFATDSRDGVPEIKSAGMASSTSVMTVNAPKDTSLEVGYQYHGLYKNSPGDKSKRTTTYMIMGGTRFLYAAAVRVFILKLLATWSASADVLALSSVEYDVSALEEGENTTIKWRGKPIFIRHLTAEEVASVEAEDISGIRDPQSHADRVKKPEWVVMLGVCTHLGCVPIAKAGEWNGYFCPCHGSHYDASGRIMKGPAPENMEIPEYKFMDENTILIG